MNSNLHSDLVSSPEVLDAAPHIAAAAAEACLRRDDRGSLEAFFRGHHVADIARILSLLDPDDARICLDLLELDRRGDVFSHLDGEQQAAVAAGLRRRELAHLVSAMSPDDRADFYNRLPPERQQAVLPALAHAEREDLRKLSAYADGTAGATMTSDYVTLAPHRTAAEALELLRREAPDKETIYNSYVVDSERKLLGSVSLRDLILAGRETTVDQLMDSSVAFGKVDDPREHAARKIAHYDLLALPIVNGGHKLVGIITHDDAMDVREQETTEDFHKGATVAPLETSLRAAGFGLLYRKRIPWLVILIFGNLFSGAGIAYFEDTISRYVALVFFLPLLIDSGGNAGSQAATLTVRALATGDVALRDWAKLLSKEVLVAGALGFTMAAAVAFVGLARGGPALALVVASTMVLVVVVGSLVGALLPFVLSRLRMDPATASAPLITSIADLSGVLIYFAIATALLPRLLPGGG